MTDGSRLFLLEMGEPVSIMDLAQQMIALSGRRNVEIEITGLRPGEKLTEALLDETERALPCAPKVMEVVSNSAARHARSPRDPGGYRRDRRDGGRPSRPVRPGRPGPRREARRRPNLRVVAGG